MSFYHSLVQDFLFIKDHYIGIKTNTAHLPRAFVFNQNNLELHCSLNKFKDLSLKG